MNCKLYLDARAPKRDGTCPVKVSISYKHRVAYIPTSVTISPDRWNAQASCVTRGSDKVFINSSLRTTLMGVEDAMVTALRSGDCSNATDLKNRILRIMQSSQREQQNGASMVEYFQRVADTKNGSTREKYNICLRYIKLYDAHWQLLTFPDIDMLWLKGLDDTMLKGGCRSADTRSMYMRCLRHVILCAIDDDLCIKNPFRKFKIEQEPVKQKALTIAQLRQLMQWDVEPYQQKYRDFFLLSFYLRGMNPSDLLDAQWSDINGDYLEYKRNKTGKWYYVRLEPEALDIINRYKGKTHLLRFTEERQSPKSFSAKCNMHLKKIGIWEKGIHSRKFVKGLFPALIINAARHTWATLAYDITDDFKAVEVGMGHSKTVTDRYVIQYRKKVDQVNRTLIDYLHNKIDTAATQP